MSQTSTRTARKPVLALRWYEDALALASYLEGQGFAEEAANTRQYAAQIRPVTTSQRWAERSVS